jgi:hypothetical protein
VAEKMTTHRTLLRAPRLSPRQRIAAHVTRVGRFRAVDPSKGKPLPSLMALLGRAGWALLLEESFRRAWSRAARASAGPSER